MTGYMSDKAKAAELISPDDLPQEILSSLSHKEIGTLGYWLFAQLRNQKEYTQRKMKPIELESCAHMTISDFVSSVKSGMFTNDDGHGYYATNYEQSDIRVRLAGVKNGKVREEWTHVCWYNK